MAVDPLDHYDVVYRATRDAVRDTALLFVATGVLVLVVLFGLQMAIYSFSASTVTLGSVAVGVLSASLALLAVWRLAGLWR
ncbi:hypothetical protein [Halospeciosus flavus]|uniref:Uncharacterized protein n=1 Tax=Halospeciosus flavus TaxID=3032283 RepID=A0ABD5Z881_9EURY|nr:hypothetical protein [Halospeciosus flavus]